MELALGKLGWTEREYYMSSPEAVHYAFRGYFSKLQDESLAIRNAATIIFRALGGKENMDKIWPITGMKDAEVYEKPDINWWNEMQVKQALIDKKIRQKNGR